MPRLLISAAHKSSGKTTVSIGLCAALTAKGLAVQPFKKGPDYIDPMWLSIAAGRPCRNLDFFVQEREEIVQSVVRHGANAGLSVIEGNKGLYDGLDLQGSNSNAALARLLDTPVILVIDARGMTRGIAPLILGYQAFDRSIRIAGVILNNLGGSRHEAKLRAVIEHYTDVAVVGAVHADDRLGIVERHLGLMPGNEAAEAAAKAREIGALIGPQLDLDRILTIAGEAPALESEAVAAALPVRSPVSRDRVRIGIARDSAFGFYYPDDLEALEAAGAELVPFNTLTDARLPEVDGLFIGGGFPEVLMDKLEANLSLREDVRAAVERGLPVYAECGGLMYLARSIRWNGATRQMVGAIPADVVMHAKPVGRGYVKLEPTADHPWLAGDAAEVRAHEFHYSSLENLDPGLRFAYRVERGHGVDGDRDGIVYRNVLASYTHLRSVGGNDWAARFADFVRRVKAQSQQPVCRACTCGASLGLAAA
ncbi:MAG: hydrogenobyrinic acid a,c-diamide synthase (glutamine-hydrolyzing) [Betaproteobacteria bacterium]|nr:hydrogenobyrinic acid a,c-diamide synthase (glutamine-hydrolyzing) [Betaproteobacteria bacterium]